MFAPMFAADEVSVIITLIVMAVSAIGWVFNMLSGKNQPQRPPVSRPKRERPIEDVNIFLEDSPRPERPTGQKSKKKAPAAPPPRPAPVSRRPGSEMSARHLQTSDLGSGVREHTAESSGRRVEQTVQDHMQRRVDASVSSHLGAFSAAPEARQPLGGASSDLVKTLQNPASVRQAMIINLLLSPPPALTNRTKKV